MKKLMLLAVIVVNWNLSFVSNANSPITVYQRSQTFGNKAEAEQFIEKAPRGWFECIESLYGQRGICEVKDMRIGK